MFWIGIIIGLFVGVNVGVVVAGMLFSAKFRDNFHSNIERDRRVDATGVDSAENENKSYPSAHPSDDVPKESSD
jgi:hypothetical protein